MQNIKQVIDRIPIAKQHTMEAEQRYALEIDKSIQKTILYDSDYIFYEKLTKDSPSFVFNYN